MHITDKTEIGDIVIPVTAECIFKNLHPVLLEIEPGNKKIVWIIYFRPAFTLNNFCMNGFFLHVNQYAEYKFIVTVFVNYICIIDQKFFKCSLTELPGKFIQIKSFIFIGKIEILRLKMGRDHICDNRIVNSNYSAIHACSVLVYQCNIAVS